MHHIAQKRFEVWQVQRTSVTVSQEAQTILNASHHQGRLIPLALSEAFGTLGNIASISITTERKIDHFPTWSDPQALLFCIIIKHGYTKVEDYRYFINVSDLEQRDKVSHLPLLLAGKLAQELVRLYPYKQIPIPDVEEDEEAAWQQDLA